MQTETTNAATGANPVQEFHLRQVFLKNVSFDAPLLNDYPTKFLSADSEDVEFRASTRAWRFQPSLYAMELRLEILMSQNGEGALSIASNHLGTFKVIGYSEAEAVELVRTKGVEAVYPYARELAHSLASRCGIQRLGLPPLAIEGAGSEGLPPGTDGWAKWLTHRD